MRSCFDIRAPLDDLRGHDRTFDALEVVEAGHPLRLKGRWYLIGFGPRRQMSDVEVGFPGNNHLWPMVNVLQRTWHHLEHPTDGSNLGRFGTVATYTLDWN